MLKNRSARSAAVFGVAALVLALAAAPVGAQGIAPKLLECNSAIDLSFTTATFAPGATVGVQMNLVNGPSNDSANLAVAQDVDSITYFPDCSTIVGNVCTVNPTPELSFAGLTSNTCFDDLGNALMVTSTVAADGSVAFTFGPSPELRMPAAAAPAGTDNSCSIFFDVMISPTASTSMTIDSLAVSGTNDCVMPLGDPPLNSVASGTQNLSPVPTLGQAALLALALVMAVGGWMVLRRRTAGGALGA